MTTLEISQIIFNFTTSLAIIVVAVLWALIALEVLKSIHRAKKFVKNVKEESTELYRKLDIFLAGFAAMPFLMNIFKKRKKKHEK